MNGTSITRRGNTVFVPLPRELWKSCGTCSCPVCQGREGFWDTLSLAAKPAPRDNDTAWTVHAPELHRVTYAGIHGAQARLAADS